MAAVNIGSLVSMSLGKKDNVSYMNSSIEILDSGVLIYKSGPHIEQFSKYNYSANMFFNNQYWKVILSPTNKFFLDHLFGYFWQIILFAMIITIIFGSFTLLISGNADTLKRLLLRHIKGDNEVDRNSSFLGNIKDAVCVTDDNGDIVFANKEFERATGYSIDDILGMKCHKIVGCEDKESGVSKKNKSDNDKIYDTLKTGITQLDIDAYFINRNGSKTPIRYNSNPIFDERNDVVAVVIIFKDI